MLPFQAIECYLYGVISPNGRFATTFCCTLILLNGLFRSFLIFWEKFFMISTRPEICCSCWYYIWCLMYSNVHMMNVHLFICLYFMWVYLAFLMLLYLLYSDEEDFPPEASSLLIELVNGAVLQAQVVAVEEDQVPYVLLAKPVGNQVWMRSLQCFMYKGLKLIFSICGSTCSFIEAWSIYNGIRMAA